MPGDYPRNQVIFILEPMPRNKRTNQLPLIISSREAASEDTSSIYHGEAGFSGFITF